MSIEINKVVDIIVKDAVQANYIIRYVHIPIGTEDIKPYFDLAVNDLMQEDRFGMTILVFSEVAQLDVMPTLETEYFIDNEWVNIKDLSEEDFTNYSEDDDIDFRTTFYHIVEWTRSMEGVADNLMLLYHPDKNVVKQMAESSCLDKNSRYIKHTTEEIKLEE